MRLQERADYLTECIDADPTKNMAYKAQERSAILWAIEQLDLMDAIEDVVIDSDLDDAQKVFAIVGVLDSRKRPSRADMERTPGLRKYIERRAVAEAGAPKQHLATAASDVAQKEQ